MQFKYNQNIFNKQAGFVKISSETLFSGINTGLIEGYNLKAATGKVQIAFQKYLAGEIEKEVYQKAKRDHLPVIYSQPGLLHFDFDASDIPLTEQYNRLIEVFGKEILHLHTSANGRGLHCYFIAEWENEKQCRELQVQFAAQLQKELGMEADAKAFGAGRPVFIAHSNNPGIPPYYNPRATALYIKSTPAGNTFDSGAIKNNTTYKAAPGSVTIEDLQAFAIYAIKTQPEITGAQFDDLCFCIAGLYGEAGREHWLKIATALQYNRLNDWQLRLEQAVCFMAVNAKHFAKQYVEWGNWALGIFGEGETGRKYWDWIYQICNNNPAKAAERFAQHTEDMRGEVNIANQFRKLEAWGFRYNPTGKADGLTLPESKSLANFHYNAKLKSLARRDKSSLLRIATGAFFNLKKALGFGAWAVKPASGGEWDCLQYLSEKEAIIKELFYSALEEQKTIAISADTAGGKTYTTLKVCREIINEVRSREGNNDFRIALIVPNRSQAIQISKNYNNEAAGKNFNVATIIGGDGDAKSVHKIREALEEQGLIACTLAAFVTTLHEVQFDLVVIDEAHQLYLDYKSEYKAAQIDAFHDKHNGGAVYLTGTPIQTFYDSDSILHYKFNIANGVRYEIMKYGIRPQDFYYFNDFTDIIKYVGGIATQPDAGKVLCICNGLKDCVKIYYALIELFGLLPEQIAINNSQTTETAKGRAALASEALEVSDGGEMRELVINKQAKQWFAECEKSIRENSLIPEGVKILVCTGVYEAGIDIDNTDITDCIILDDLHSVNRQFNAKRVKQFAARARKIEVLRVWLLLNGNMRKEGSDITQPLKNELQYQMEAETFFHGSVFKISERAGKILEESDFCTDAAKYKLLEQNTSVTFTGINKRKKMQEGYERLHGNAKTIEGITRLALAHFPKHRMIFKVATDDFSISTTSKAPEIEDSKEVLATVKILASNDKNAHIKALAQFPAAFLAVQKEIGKGKIDTVIKECNLLLPGLRPELLAEIQSTGDTMKHTELINRLHYLLSIGFDFEQARAITCKHSHKNGKYGVRSIFQDKLPLALMLEIERLGINPLFSKILPIAEIVKLLQRQEQIKDLPLGEVLRIQQIVGYLWPGMEGLPEGNRKQYEIKSGYIIESFFVVGEKRVQSEGKQERLKVLTQRINFDYLNEIINATDREILPALEGVQFPEINFHHWLRVLLGLQELGQTQPAGEVILEGAICSNCPF